MRGSDDTVAQAAGILSGEVRDVDVRAEQALSAYGEAAQPRTGRRGISLREASGRPRRGIHVPRAGVGFGGDYRDIRHGTQPV